MGDQVRLVHPDELNPRHSSSCLMSASNQACSRDSTKQLSPFTVPVKDDDGSELSIAGLFSQKSNPIPIVFLHGWPGTFLEFMGILAILENRYTPQELPYHVIVPSLPGYAFSGGPPLDKNWATKDMARMMHNLVEIPSTHSTERSFATED